MTTAECLRKLREMYLAKEHRTGCLVWLPELLTAAADGDANVAFEALEFLDKLSPGGSFGMWLDSPKMVTLEDETFEWQYHYDRKPHEVAALIGRACVMSETAEM